MVESDRVSEELSEKSFKCCVKKPAKVAVCIHCGNVFHRSCLERKNYTVIDETRIICCTVHGNGESKIADLKEGTTKKETLEWLQNENYLLRKLLKEKDEKCMLLIENKQHLEDKLKYLSEVSKNQSTFYYKNLEDKKRDQQNSDNEVLPKQITDLNKINNNDEKSSSSSTQDMKTIELKVNEVEAVITQTLQTNEEDNDNDGFILVEKRKRNKNQRRSNKKLIGNAEAENDEEFTGEKPKVWLYLYRVKQHVTAAHIQTYIRKKLGNIAADAEEIIVKELNSENKRLKCFMVGADIEHKEKFYNASFWPRGVGFKRFNFKRYHEYNKRTENMNSDFL